MIPSSIFSRSLIGGNSWRFSGRALKADKGSGYFSNDYRGYYPQTELSLIYSSTNTPQKIGMSTRAISTSPRGRPWSGAFLQASGGTGVQCSVPGKVDARRTLQSACSPRTRYSSVQSQTFGFLELPVPGPFCTSKHIRRILNWRWNKTAAITPPLGISWTAEVACSSRHDHTYLLPLWRKRLRGFFGREFTGTNASLSRRPFRTSPPPPSLHLPCCPRRSSLWPVPPPLEKWLLP